MIKLKPCPFCGGEKQKLKLFGTVMGWTEVTKLRHAPAAIQAEEVEA